MLSKEEISTIEKSVVGARSENDDVAAWATIQPLLIAQPKQLDAARALLRIVDEGVLSVEHALGTLEEIELAYPEDAELLSMIGYCLESARDIDFLNGPPPDHPIFARVIKKLARFLDAGRGEQVGVSSLRGLATAARQMARQYDDLAGRCYRRLVEVQPANAANHYALGLFCKTRGLFEQGVLANREALRLAGKSIDRYEWNLGICATGAGRGELALEVWRRLNQKIEMGCFGLPEGLYPQCKVRLAERPLAERNAELDDPGSEETVWIERLSPCHGIIRSVLYGNLGVDYGDVVLIDGAPITYHNYGDKRVPVFPHLATLLRRNYQFFDFTGTQLESKQIAGLSAELDGDAVIYSHTENYQVLCMGCWRDPDADHEHSETEEKLVVVGRIAAPPDLEASTLIEQIDKAVTRATAARFFRQTSAKRPGCPIAPDSKDGALIN